MRLSVTIIVAVFALSACGRQPVPASQPAPTPLPTTSRPAPPAAAPQPSRTATATIRDLAGIRVGTATLTESYAGVIIAGTVTGLGLGAHAVHIHEFGRCEPPFTTAGRHFNPQGHRHGFFSSDGGHLGDLPNIVTPAAGALHFEFLLPDVTLRATNALVDSDGASIVIHSGRDNFYTNPEGDSGARIACGIIILK